MGQKEDKRLSPRRDINVAVTTQSHSRLQEFYAKNISGGGIFLEMEESPAMGERFKLAFTIPGKNEPLQVEAEVVRHHPIETMDADFNPKQIQGVGLRFTDLTAEQQQLIEQYVRGRGLSVQG